uniref:Putative outer-membrane immunogenic protein n=1 Tax=Methylocapsa acidiphila TaxID=133552 RepID=Q2VNG9_METAI|nr:putative outer-membrane immunogenic protein precursor [Methylocapsa acidiphila]
MRTFLLASAGAVALAGSAFAADLPSRAPPPAYVPPAPIFTWTGVYIGGQIGYAWTNPNVTYGDAGYTVGGFPLGYADSYNVGGNANGVIGGAHVGYNLQLGQWVLGLEGDVDGSSISKTVSVSPYSSYYADYIPTTFHSNLGIQGSIRGRVGIAWDRALLYATGGVAFGGFTSYVSTSYANPQGILSNFPFSGNDSFSQTRVGWTVGGGLEYAITNNWSVRGEYRYTDFGHTSNYLVNAFPVYPGDVSVGAWVHRHLTENRVQVGFSYKFDTFQPAPVVAKY